MPLKGICLNALLIGIRDPEGCGGAGVTEDKCGAEGKEEPDGARGTRHNGGVQSRGEGWSMTDQGLSQEGRGSPTEPVD